MNAPCQLHLIHESLSHFLFDCVEEILIFFLYFQRRGHIIVLSLREKTSSKGSWFSVLMFHFS